MSHQILIVDDEKNIRRMLSIIFESEGYAVREALTGEGALASMADRAADLVLLDVGLPGISGIDVLARLRAAHPEAAVVLISGHASLATAI